MIVRRGQAGDGLLLFRFDIENSKQLMSRLLNFTAWRGIMQSIGGINLY